ncbi:MAG: hypothetical protein ACREQA_15670 [Candidatus Binatia bacterium]
MASFKRERLSMELVQFVMKRLLVICLALLSAGSALSAEAIAPQPRRGGTITLAIQKDLVVMNPMIRTASTEISIKGFGPKTRIPRKPAFGGAP